MPNTGSSHRPTRAPRKIGPIGTTARTIVGTLLVGSVVQGPLAGPFRPAAWALGLVGFPTLLLGWQWLRARRTPTHLKATGPVANVVNPGRLAGPILDPGVPAGAGDHQRRRPPVLWRLDAAGRAS